MYRSSEPQLLYSAPSSLTLIACATSAHKCTQTAMSAPAEDEFDALPDVYAGIDFDKIEALCGPPRAASPKSESEYSFDELDEATLAEVDAIVARELQKTNATNITSTLQRTSGPSPEGLHPNTTVTEQRLHDEPPPTVGPAKRPHASTSTASPRKRRNASSPTCCHECSPSSSPAKSTLRQSSPHPPKSPTSSCRATQRAASQIVRKLLEDMGDELTCPICCDLFVSPHVGSTCGHSYCGQCGWDWIVKTMPAPTCPCCRTPLNTPVPMVPNFAMESILQKHVAMLAENGVEGWEEGGDLRREWSMRHDQWKAGAAARAKEMEKYAKAMMSSTLTRPAWHWPERVLIDLSDEPEG